MKKLSTILLIPVFSFLLKNNIINTSIEERENHTIELTKDKIIIKENNQLLIEDILDNQNKVYQINHYNICFFNSNDHTNLSNCDFIYLNKYNDSIDLKLSSKTHAIIYQNNIKFSNKLLESIYLNWIDTYPNDHIYLLLEEPYQIKNID